MDKLTARDLQAEHDGMVRDEHAAMLGQEAFEATEDAPFSMAPRPAGDGFDGEAHKREVAAIEKTAVLGPNGKPLAPNGKESNLTLRQWATVRTKAFRNWFGDWLALAEQSKQMQSGKAAIEKLLAEKAGEVMAMNRPGIGDVWFMWGTPGRLNSKGRLIEGKGISHLIEQRNLEGNDGEAVARLMPDVIANGQVVAIQGSGTNGERIRIFHKGHTALLSLFDGGQRKTWLLSGWENEDGGSGVNPETAYAPAPSGISGQVGASGDMVALNAGIVNPESVSKVVDENGEPMVVYHGTTKEFDAFAIKQAAMFSEQSEKAGKYGPVMIAGFLNVRNPYSASLNEVESLPYYFNQASPRSRAQRLAGKGFDGAVHADQWAIFDPAQIKSVDNRGSFDQADDRYRFSLAPASVIDSLSVNAASRIKDPRVKAAMFTRMLDNSLLRIRGDLIFDGNRRARRLPQHLDRHAMFLGGFEN